MPMQTYWENAENSVRKIFFILYGGQPFGDGKTEFCRDSVLMALFAKQGKRYSIVGASRQNPLGIEDLIFQVKIGKGELSSPKSQSLTGGRGSARILRLIKSIYYSAGERPKTPVSNES